MQIKNSTICTFYFELNNIKILKNNKNYCYQNYFDSFKKLKNLSKNLYVWIDEKYYNDLKKYTDDNTIIISKNITDLRLYLYKNKIINCLNHMNNKRNKNKYSALFKQHCDFNSIAEYIILNNSKFDIINECCNLNPFNTEIYTWFDFGLFQHDFANNIISIQPNFTYNILIGINYNCKKIEKYNIIDEFNKLCLISSNNDNIEFIGGIFTINKSFFYNFYINYFNLFFNLLNNNLTSTEQGLLTIYFNNINISKYDIIKTTYNNISILI